MNGVPKGIRTPVTAVKGRCPGPLDDGDVFNKVSLLATRYRFEQRTGIGGARRDRTADLLHAMQALSQLSYSPIKWESAYSNDVIKLRQPPNQTLWNTKSSKRFNRADNTANALDPRSPEKSQKH